MSGTDATERQRQGRALPGTQRHAISIVRMADHDPDIPPLRAIFGLAGDLAGQLSDDEIADAYAWPAERRWVRAMMVTSLDGAAAGPDGLSGSLSSEADQRVFRAVRRFADAVLIGAGTLRAEEYTPMVAKPDDAARRRASGQSPAPRIAVVSRSLDLPWHLPVWTESHHRPVVLTGRDVDPSRLAEAEDHAEVLALESTGPAAVLDALTARGLRRIVCEGGPHLLRDLLAAGLVDEADITVSPVFAGTLASPDTPAISPPVRARLAHVLAGEDSLMTRYLLEQR